MFTTHIHVNSPCFAHKLCLILSIFFLHHHRRNNIFSLSIHYRFLPILLHKTSLTLPKNLIILWRIACLLLFNSNFLNRSLLLLLLILLTDCIRRYRIINNIWFDNLSIISIQRMSSNSSRRGKIPFTSLRNNAFLFFRNWSLFRRACITTILRTWIHYLRANLHASIIIVVGSTDYRSICYGCSKATIISNWALLSSIEFHWSKLTLLRAIVTIIIVISCWLLDAWIWGLCNCFLDKALTSLVGVIFGEFIRSVLIFCFSEAIFLFKIIIEDLLC